MRPHSLTSPQVGNFGRWSCENVRRKSQMFEREVAQKSDEICAKTSMSDGWSHQNELKRNSRKSTSFATLMFTWLPIHLYVVCYSHCKWLLPRGFLPRDSPYLSSSSGRGSLLIWLRRLSKSRDFPFLFRWWKPQYTAIWVGLFSGEAC